MADTGTTSVASKKLKVDEYTYTFERISKDGKLKFWRCDKRYEGCKNRIHTSVETGEVVPFHSRWGRQIDHNHGTGWRSRGPAFTKANKKLLSESRDYEGRNEAAASANLGDESVSESFELSDSAVSPASKRIKRSAQEEEEMDEFGETDNFAHNQVMSEPTDAYYRRSATQEEGIIFEHCNGNVGSPKLFADNTESNRDILTTLVRNQQLMMDAMHRLESKLDSVQQSQVALNMRLITLENQTGSVLTFATETHDATKQIQKFFDTLETRLDNIAANDSYSNPVAVSSDNNGIVETALTTSIDHSWDEETAVPNVASEAEAAQCSSLVASCLDSVSCQSTELLQQFARFCSSTNTPSSSGSAVSAVSYRRGNRRPGAKLPMDPTNPSVGWIGGNPDFQISFSDYAEIWTKSGGSPLRMLFALLAHVYGDPENLKHLSWSGKDGRQPLKDEPAFAPCVAQVSLQFPSFKMTAVVRTQIARRLTKLRRRHVSPPCLLVSREEVGSCPSSRLYAEDGFRFTEIPVTSVSAETDVAGALDNIDVIVKSEVVDDWIPETSRMIP